MTRHWVAKFYRRSGTLSIVVYNIGACHARNGLLSAAWSRLLQLNLNVNGFKRKYSFPLLKWAWLAQLVRSLSSDHKVLGSTDLQILIWEVEDTEVYRHQIFPRSSQWTWYSKNNLRSCWCSENFALHFYGISFVLILSFDLNAACGPTALVSYQPAFSQEAILALAVY